MIGGKDALWIKYGTHSDGNNQRYPMKETGGGREKEEKDDGREDLQIEKK